MTTVTEQELITRTALDYFEGWFTGDVARMRRALHPGLAKRALDGEGALDETTAEWMIEATAEGRGKRDGVETDVEVVDVYGDIATAVVRSSVYREYLHLLRTDEGWKIVNALWQRT
jgi:hypothetical protein